MPLKNCKINKSDIVLVTIYILINGLVLYNVVFHSHSIGYDAGGHSYLIKIVSKLRLATLKDSYLGYMPPLYYIIPALIYKFGHLDLEHILKLTQLSHFFISLGITYYLLKICELIRPNNSIFKIMSLSFLGIMPIYYKALSFIRSEPLFAFLTVLAVYFGLKTFLEKSFSVKNCFWVGLYIGLAIITRPTALALVLTFISFVILLICKNTKNYKVLLKKLALIMLIAYLIGGWFYVRNYFLYDNVLNFVRSGRKEVTLSNQPKEFYFGSGNGKLFKSPIRKAFSNQLLPTFYSDFWGDYWCYFLVYGKKVSEDKFISGTRVRDIVYKSKGGKDNLETNYHNIKRYLGRVNAVSLFPSLLMLLGILLGLICTIKMLFTKDKTLPAFALGYLTIACSLMCYFYFLIKFPALHKGDNIKPTYVFQVFPFIALLAGELTSKIKEKLPVLFYFIIGYLLFTAIHNIGAMHTHFKVAVF